MHTTSEETTTTTSTTAAAKTDEAVALQKQHKPATIPYYNSHKFYNNKNNDLESKLNRVYALNFKL